MSFLSSQSQGSLINTEGGGAVTFIIKEYTDVRLEWVYFSLVFKPLSI